MKTKISIALIVLGFFFATAQEVKTENPNIKVGMIKVSIFYPNGEGNTFDMDYYTNKHLPMAASLFGDALKAMGADKGIVNAAPDMPLKYLAIGYLYFENMEAYKAAMAANSGKLRADVPNYTNIKPELQISQVQMIE